MSRAERRSERVLKGMQAITPKVVPIATDMVIPNLSGTKRDPLHPKELATKKYVDDNIETIEGLDILSTGEGGATKYLREDGDGTCSWQAPAGGGDVTAAVNLTDETIVQGDGGAKGVKTSTATVTQIAANVAHAADNTQAHSDYLINNGNDTTSGTITWSGGTSAEANTAYTHSQDNTQAHSDYLLNSGTDVAVGPLTITADNSTADQAYVPMVLYNTDDTPPAANTVPRGTIYIQYTA